MREKQKRILFVEDEPDQRMMVSLRLQKSGFLVMLARDGYEGLTMAIKEKPDLILLDIIMPGMDGFELCQKLREQAVTKMIPIIATTAAGTEDLESKCLSVGADECIRKPYESSDLLDKIRGLLEI